MTPRKEKDAKAVAKEADIRVLRIKWGGMIPRVSLRFTLGYEPLALLGHSTFQVVWPVVLTRIFTELSGFPQIILGQRDKRVCAWLSAVINHPLRGRTVD